jgi:hypothetical protein
MCIYVRIRGCDIRYDFHIKTMFSSSLPPVVCRRTHVLFTLYVFVCGLWCITYIFALFFSVLCTLRYQFLWIVHFWLSLRYSLTFILFPFKTVYKWYYIFSNYLHLLLRPYTKHRQILKYLKNSDSVKSTYCKLYSTFMK